jgi:putative hydrolase of the HAD superfamily
MSYLIWDFDNTLAYRPGQWSQCLADVTNSALPSARLPREQFVPYLSRGFPWHTPERDHHHLSDADAWWTSVLPVLATAIAAVAGIDGSFALEIAARVRAAYLDPTRWVVFPDTEPSLTALAGRGWRHTILSNHVPELSQLIEALGLGHHFDNVITSASLGYEKPHPSAFKAAIEKVPSNGQIIMIGDSFLADYKGARAVGLDAVLVRGSHEECDRSCPDLNALIGYLHEA